ncbi:hypothetical protein IIC38_15025 [candidate division KSB1 bacterium]|nr:hypothetical protein [candidate division KSB1 bacterium]
MNFNLLFDLLFRVKIVSLILFLIWVAASNCQLIAQPKLIFNTHTDHPYYGSVEVGEFDFPLDRLQSTNLSTRQWQEFFSVYTGKEIPLDSKHPPIMGSYSVDGKIIRFQPRFPFVAGLVYTARFDGTRFNSLIGKQSQPGQSTTKVVTHTFPKKESIATTFIENVYPSTNSIPENLLKFYIQFSAPMSRGNVYRFVYLMDESGQKVKQPFLELEQGLWDSASKRLTIFFDPGRIKRGLRQHEEMGLALKPGASYRLTIDRELQDADGNPLTKSYIKQFSVIEADRKSPNPDNWKIVTPGAKSFEPIIVSFPEPLDHALVGRLLSIRNGGNELVDGTIQISKQETRWSFKPINYWDAGNYVIHVKTTLEDLAGNNLKSVFDVDVTRKGDQLTDREAITIPFRVR